VSGSRWQLREMLTNLVDNAIRYTPVGGGSRPLRPAGRGSVRRGRGQRTGIDPDERRRVFERFYRSPKAVAEGSGLGLSIVREIAQSHEAQVQVLDAEGGPGVVVRVLFRSA
jgi:signal transduction histidine kinase